MNNITGQLIVHEHFIIYIKNYYYRLQSTGCSWTLRQPIVHMPLL